MTERLPYHSHAGSSRARRKPTLRRWAHHRRSPEKSSSGGYKARGNHLVGLSQVPRLRHSQRASPLLAELVMNVPSWVPGSPNAPKPSAAGPALPLLAHRGFPTTSPSAGEVSEKPRSPLAAETRLPHLEVHRRMRRSPASLSRSCRVWILLVDRRTRRFYQVCLGEGARRKGTHLGSSRE